MGLLNIFKAKTGGSADLPSGSFTVDRSGSVIASTITTRFPKSALLEIAETTLRIFSDARNAQMSFTEVNMKFGAIDIRAVEMRGGAMIFLSPRSERQNRLATTT